ncbi:hypothetical protein [Paludisphaera mucosa]|uniref:Uncharacterized protein n=1 Tax=Paludisphaera mucosa TaxID=3030827 RepID=A0ABT6F561_9BACT|nr:hypothetical protein [Paludisphaera mucosa]MDG3002723.1 hypothetical protein [Paludisphaera mucosa]
MSSGTSGAQDWRAIACLAPTGERLLCVGESSSQVRAAYAGAWGEVIRDEDRPTVRAISLQRWTGQFWSGQWEHQTYLAVPATRTGKAPGGDAEGDVDGEIEMDGELENGLAVAVETEVEEVEDEEDDLLETGGSKSKSK